MARGLQALLLEVILAVRSLHMRHPLLGTTCGLLRKNLVLKHQADVYQRKQITDCLFKLLATTFKQPSPNMFISILMDINFLQDHQNLLMDCLLSFLFCV